jgi:hypothetical protein
METLYGGNAYSIPTMECGDILTIDQLEYSFSRLRDLRIRYHSGYQDFYNNISRRTDEVKSWTIVSHSSNCYWLLYALLPRYFAHAIGFDKPINIKDVLKSIGIEVIINNDVPVYSNGGGGSLKVVTTFIIAHRPDGEILDEDIVILYTTFE